MSEEKWQQYADDLKPHKYLIGGCVLLGIGLFYLTWIGYFIYRAIKVRKDLGKAAMAMETQLKTEFWKYILTTIGMCFQYGVVVSYIVGKIVKSLIVENHFVEVYTCDTSFKVNETHMKDTTPKSALIYYYAITLSQVFAMLCASCMLSTFNLVLKYLKSVFYKKVYSTLDIGRCVKLLIFEFVFITVISILGVGIPFALVILFFCVLVKFIRFSLSCKEGYKVYTYRIEEIKEKATVDESLIDHGDSLESECTHYGYITTVFCFGAGFYVAQLIFDPLATLVEASCTIFPDNTRYIKILFHFMNLLVWGSFAMVIIIFVPFFLPYTLYYSCIACCPTKVLNFVSRASRCFRKPPAKIQNELVQPLINKETKSSEE